MKMLLIIVLSMAAATVIGVVSINDPGLMVLSYGLNTWELPLTLGILLIAVAFALMYLLLNFLFSLWRSPRQVGKWNKRRQGKNAQQDTLRGYAQLIEGNWAQGEKSLVKRLPHSKTPMLNYLGAAYAAQQQQDFTKRDEYLVKAEKTDPANRMAVDITRARMLTQAGDYANAKPLLENMSRNAPGNKTILRLMSDVCQRTEDWQGIQKLLPALKRTKALPEQQLSALDLIVRREHLIGVNSADNDGSSLAQYKRLPRKQKQNGPLAVMYAKDLINQGKLSEAEMMVRVAIKKNWSAELADLYGQTRTDNLRKQISFAATWLAEHEHEPSVNLTLARLNLAYNQTEKALKYYKQAISLGAGDAAYYELGKFHEQEGNAALALKCYKKGVESTLGESDQNQNILADGSVQSGALSSVVMPGALEGQRMINNDEDSPYTEPKTQPQGELVIKKD